MGDVLARFVPSALREVVFETEQAKPERAAARIDPPPARKAVREGPSFQGAGHPIFGVRKADHIGMISTKTVAIVTSPATLDT